MQGFIRQAGVGIVKKWEAKTYDDSNVTYINVEIPQYKQDGVGFTSYHTVELRGKNALNTPLETNQLIAFEGMPKVSVYMRDGEPKYSTSTVVYSVTILRNEFEFPGDPK